MKRFIISSTLTAGIILMLTSCESQLQKRIQFSIASIVLEQTTIAQGQSANITAAFTIAGGSTNQSKPDVVWESDRGLFGNTTNISTIWTAPADYLGETKIKLTATFMGHTDVAEISVRIVKTPADGWGSLSGYLLTEDKIALPNISVLTSTGEGVTTDASGYFYIADIPQGSTGLNFTGISYAWATELPQQITISNGTHQHLGQILMYESLPARINDYTNLPERRAILSFDHFNPALVNFHELYRANDINGSGASLITTLEPDLTEWEVQETSNDGFYAIRTTPLNGDVSDFSPWFYVPLINVVDPDPSKTTITVNDFFNATIAWEPTGFETYYKGFRIAESNGAAYDFISPVLSVGTTDYNIVTEPGKQADYFVMAIAASGLYNTTQPDTQQIHLEVPQMEPPSNLRAALRPDSTLRVLWEPIALDNTWYDGYLLEKKIVTQTDVFDWEELTRIASSATGEYIDVQADAGNVYHYRIQTIAYPDQPGNVYYSAADSTSLSTE